MMWKTKIACLGQIQGSDDKIRNQGNNVTEMAEWTTWKNMAREREVDKVYSGIATDRSRKAWKKEKT